MTKAKKIKAPLTELDRIAARLRTALRRETTNIIEIGNLLIESRKHLDHGEWQPWLAEHFDLSYRTAVRYVDAAEYVERSKGKSDTVADFTNLAPTVLYWLAANHYSAEEEAAILAATRKGRVDQTRASAICDELAPPDSDEPDDDDEPDQPDEGEEAVEAAEDAESAAILDGPPPDVPPSASSSPPDFALREFDHLISRLKQLMTKSAAQFASTIHTASDLEGIESFIRAVRLREVQHVAFKSEEEVSQE
jgi:hypothetical protein